MSLASQITAGFAAVADKINDLTYTPINAQTGTSYTLAISDLNGMVTMNNASPNTLTVPPNNTVAFPIGSRIEGMTLGVGPTTIVPGSGVTLDAPFGVLVAPRQYTKFELIKIAINTWLVIIDYQPGLEIGYTEVTTYSLVAMNTTSADAVGLAVTVNVGARPIFIEGYMPSTTTDQSGRTRMAIMEGATIFQLADSGVIASGPNVAGTVRAQVRLGGTTQPSVGSHTYKIQMRTVISTSGSYTSGATFPAFIRVTEG